MTEIEIIARAQMYLEKLANGVNPLTDEEIAENDVSYKVKHAREFIEEGNHVKFRVFLKGREMANPQSGIDVLNKIWPMIEDIAVMDKEPKLEGRYVNMMALPKN